jgi:PAS domain-containing protein
MNDQDKTREELKKELLELRQEHDELRKSYEKDIAERIQTEKDLRDSRLRFSDIITNLDEAYYSCELDGTLLEHNIAFKRIFGFDPNQDMKGIKISDLWQNPKERTEYLNILMNEGFIRKIRKPEVVRRPSLW